MDGALDASLVPSSASLRSTAASRGEALVVFKRGGMGSILASLPFVRQLRDSRPGAAIVFITDQANCELVERCGVADEIIAIDAAPDRRAGWRAAWLIGRLRRIAPSVFFDLQLHTHRRTAAWLAAASGAAHRVGFVRPGDRLRQHVFDTLVIANMFAPVHELYMQMARAIGCPHSDALPAVAPAVTATDVQAANALLRSWSGADHVLLVVNPNTSGKAAERRWPLPLFRQAIAGIMAHREDVRVAVIGSAAEFDHVEQLCRSLGNARGRVRNLAGRTSLGSLLALLRRAHCVLTNDSGPFHFSVALQTPTVGLFGPVHPDHYGRMGRADRTIVFYRPMMCSPCVHFVRTPPCGGNNHCMQAITPAEVRDACLRLLAGAGPASDIGWHFSAPPETRSGAGGALGIWHRADDGAPRRGALVG